MLRISGFMNNALFTHNRANRHNQKRRVFRRVS